MLTIMNETKYLVIRRGIVYEGNNELLWSLYPMPLISPAVCAFIEGQHLVFREDSFDPMTRIRRGRFYRFFSENTGHWKASNVSNGIYGRLVGISSDMFDMENGFELALPKDKVIRKEIVQIGEGNAVTTWHVVGVEQNIFGQQVYTLRAQSLLGVLPELSDVPLDRENVLVEQQKITDVRVSLNDLTDSYHRFQPRSIVDAARETTRVILAAWAGSESNSKDLKDITKLIPESEKSEEMKLIPKNMSVLSSAVHIVNRLHSRGKTSEQERQAKKAITLRDPTEDDAQTSVHLVGMILREIGWAQS